MLLIEFRLNFRRCEATAARVSYREFMAWPSSVRGARRALQMNWMTSRLSAQAVGGCQKADTNLALAVDCTSLVQLLPKLRV
jgi:hypothetical protein